MKSAFRAVNEIEICVMMDYQIEDLWSHIKIILLIFANLTS